MKLAKRLFSAVTAAAAVLSLCSGSLFSGVKPLTVEGAEVCPVGLEITADKTCFSLDEVKAGTASTKLYVDVTTQFTQYAEVTLVEFCLKPDIWGVVDPVNLILSDPNQLSTSLGNSPSVDTAFNSTSYTGSIWNTIIPNKLGYSVYNYTDKTMNNAILEYSDNYLPKATIMTDSTKGKLFTDSANSANHIAEFDVVIPTDAAEGIYTINFVNAQALVGILNETTNTMRMLPITELKPVTITIGADKTTPVVTTQVTEPAVTTKTSVSETYPTTMVTSHVTVTAIDSDGEVLYSVQIVTVPQILTTATTVATTTTPTETNDNLNYDCLTYRKIDNDSDGLYDYAEITGCDKRVTEAIIPDEIDGLPVIIAERAFIDCTNLKSVRLPEGGDYSIREWTFKGCSALEEIIVPKNVTMIENAAFCLCTNLKKITIMNTHCTIYDNAAVISNYSEYNSATGAYEQFFDGTIYGYDGSTAETYAAIYERDFVALDETPVVTTQVTTMPVVTSKVSVSETKATTTMISIWLPYFTTTSQPISGTKATTTKATTSTTVSTSVSAENTTANNENAYLSKSELEMIVGDKITIKVNDFYGNVTWMSSDDSIAVVNNGQIEAVSEGEAVIFAMLGKTNYLCCNVVVEANDNMVITTADISSDTTTTTTVNSQQGTDSVVLGDANEDGQLNVRDCAMIANRLATGNGNSLPDSADYNQDGKVNIRDAAAISSFLANGAENDEVLHAYKLMNMNAKQISNVLGDCSHSIFNGGGYCYQLTSTNYKGLHILFTDLSVSDSFDYNTVPTDIIMTQGNASDRLYCGMTMSECFELNGNQQLYINAHDSKLEANLIYDGYSFRIQFDSSYYDISNEDYNVISSERAEYYLNCNPKISEISIEKI